MQHEEIEYIEEGFTTSAAAKYLGVGRHEVVRLINNGFIKAKKTSSGFYIIDRKSLLSRNDLTVASGRPWSCATAWAALDVLGGGDADWLTYQQKYRLKKKLREIDAEQLLWLSRNRMKATTYLCSKSFMDDIQAQIITSGIGSVNVAKLQLAPVPFVVDGYVTNDEIQKLINSYCLIESPRGPLTFRTTSFLPKPLCNADEMPLAVIAADLATSLDPREKMCGLTYLERLLNEYKDS